VVSALDNRGLDKVINEVDDETDVDRELELRNFHEFTRHGTFSTTL
jgi:hypothetical protein